MAHIDFCRNCKHMNLVAAAPKPPHAVIMFCNRVVYRDGSHIDCESARDSGDCGPEGKLYEEGTQEAR